MRKTVGIEEFIKENGFFMDTTVGMSMYPMLRSKRDAVVIHPCKERLKKYDVALYKVNDDYILHRVIKVLPDSYIIRGDNRIDKEYGITDENLLGVLTSFYRDEKKISVHNFIYLIYVRFWNFIFPVRYLYKRCKSIVYRLKCKNKK